MIFFLLKKSFAAASVAAFFCAASGGGLAHAAPPDLPGQVDLAAAVRPPLAEADRWFEQLAALPADALATQAGRLVVLEVDLGVSPGFSVTSTDGRLEARYRMAFNNIAEGWSWQPQADPDREDYYRAKFMPLKSVTVERGDYMFEDKIGEPQRMKVTWRYDYFLAFDNLYDFYPRTVDDDAGFVAPLPPEAEGRVKMLAVARLGAPYLSESTTFWKATYGKPTDFTLKKRYLVGQLEAVWFYDAADGKVLARLVRQNQR